MNNFNWRNIYSIICLFFVFFFVACQPIVFTEEEKIDDTTAGEIATEPAITEEESIQTEQTEDESEMSNVSDESEATSTSTDQNTDNGNQKTEDESDATSTDQNTDNGERETEDEPKPEPCIFNYPDLSGSHVDISSELAGSYEPSGAVWHKRLALLFIVSDGGYITSLTKTGHIVSEWYIGGDLEGITVADPETDFIYIGVENPDSILEFDLSLEIVTRTFVLTSYMTGASNQGLEALTFYPDETSDEGGYFFAGLQADGYVYVFELPLVTNTVSTSLSFDRSFAPVAKTDLSGMHYDVTHDILYLIYDGYNKLVSYDMTEDIIEEWTLWGDNQEGFTIDDECGMYVSEDDGNLKRYY
ncbi:SdiA-regulated domain-containing protein [bacterium]|nr:SdiA-regulated domain-containing protein [bacterium]